MNDHTRPAPFTKPIRTGQLNINRKGFATHALLNHCIKKFDIIFLQEPSWATTGTDGTGNPIIGPIGHAGWTPVLPIPSIPGDSPPPRVMAYYKTRPDFTVTLRSNIAQDLDIQVIDVSQPGIPTTTYVNVYNDSRQRVPATEQLRALTLPDDHPVILLGDWNLHHELWSLYGIKGNARANRFVEWITDKGYSILNQKGEVTYIPHDKKRSPSVIDLTFVNVAAINHDAVKDWTIDASMSYGSDHKGVRWSTDYGRTEIDNITGIQYNLKDVKPEDWCVAFQETLELHRPEINAIMANDAVSNEALENAASAITKVMQEVTAKVAKERRPNANAKPWWNDELKAAAENLGKAQSEQSEYKIGTGSRSRTLRAKVKKAANFFKRLCKATKAKCAIRKLEEAQTEDIWGFRKWSKGIRN
ncbi:Endonuclease/exonuclease/phosphatase [Mycena maculata]|uniref:Endonuclease/exonuclease/phosphatase n=1 Tax=Mycena maculata TaxID=230809 RepID=A0AAD7NNB4_9AGAR|nr:Endonuclease/exonuclease/phosphatase [Mycena maculata]